MGYERFGKNSKKKKLLFKICNILDVNILTL